MIEVDLHRGAVNAICLFGNCKRNDAHVRIGKRGQGRMPVTSRGDDPGDTADQAASRAGSVTLKHCIKAILRVERIGDIGCPKTHPDYAPVPSLLSDSLIGIDSLMGTMECTDAKMDDTVAIRGRIIGWNGHVSFNIMNRAQTFSCHHIRWPKDS